MRKFPVNSLMTVNGNLLSTWHKLDKGQLIKWTVYALLLINWGFYFFEEIYISSHTLRQGGSFLKWTEAFATTIDEFAWFGLLFMFELETYSLSDEVLKKRLVSWWLHGFRVLCYLFLVHTIYARVMTVNDFENVTLAPEVTNLCQLAGDDISFGKNYSYTLIDDSNCVGFSNESSFYFLDPTVITDGSGHALEKKLVWLDLVEACTWLLVIFAIELAVWLQNHDITGGILMLVSHAAKLLYGILFAAAAYWAYTGHWVYTWDELLWICGFWAIEKNLSEWREEIREEEALGAYRT